MHSAASPHASVHVSTATPSCTSITNYADQQLSIRVFKNYMRTRRNRTCLKRNTQRLLELYHEEKNNQPSTAGWEHRRRKFWRMFGAPLDIPAIPRQSSQSDDVFESQPDSIFVAEDPTSDHNDANANEDEVDAGELQRAKRRRKQEFIAPPGAFSSRSMTPLIPGAQLYGESDEDSDSDDQGDGEARARERVKKIPGLTQDQIYFLAFQDHCLSKVRPRIESQGRYKDWFTYDFLKDHGAELAKRNLVNEARTRAKEIFNDSAPDQATYHKCLKSLDDLERVSQEMEEDNDYSDIPYSKCLCGDIALMRFEPVIDCKNRDCIRRTYHVKCIYSYWGQKLPDGNAYFTATNQWHCRECSVHGKGKGKGRAYD